MTLEEYQAAKKAAAEKKKLQAAQAKAAPQPTQIAQKAPAEEAAAPAEPKPAPAEFKPAPKVEVAPPPKQEAPPAAEDDWEAQADEPAPAAAEAPAPAAKPAPAPVEEAAPPPAAKAEPAPVEAPAAEAEAAEEEIDEAAEAEAAAPGEEEDDGGKKISEPDPRPHLNVVFIGHVDAGKSTTCGNILYLCGCVDARAIEKYQQEAKEKNRDSWFLAYIMDTSEEEKAKGKTVEVGRAHFETEHRRFTILDAPGHKSYVPNMISGASQADIGVLIISARKGEFETGFERGGQTREHALLAKTLGVQNLIITINKMDDQSVQWKKERFDEIQTKMAPFLKQSGFKDDQLVWLPISGLAGDNVKERKGTPDWYTGMTLLDKLDTLAEPDRSCEGSLRIPMLDGYRDMGHVMAIGKVEQGTVKPGTKCIVMPMGHKCTVTGVYINDVEMTHAKCGENVTMKMTGVTSEQLTRGFVLSVASDPVRVVTKFKAQLQIIELPEERPVLTSGYKAVMHVHVANEECEILKLYESTSLSDRKKKAEKNPRFVRENSVVTCSIQLSRPTPVDSFKGVSQLGRFTLRDEGRTIAIGRITELPKEGEATKK